MKIKECKWDGFAWTPKHCSCCGSRFWLEPYQIHPQSIIDASIFRWGIECSTCVKQEEKQYERTKRV